LEVANQETEKVQQVESGVEVAVSANGGLHHVFPAHSMTAIEFYR
jgi:hypothetical protein